MQLRPWARFLCVLAMLPTPAAAQTRDEGIAAAVRGDYEVAAYILTPLAHDPRRPDGIAQFFLALLHGTGSGVATDDTLVCGLLKESAKTVHPFSGQATELASVYHKLLGEAAPRVCTTGAPWQATAVSAGMERSYQSPEPDPAVDDTAAGVVAIARGDYTRAARILEPLALDSRRNDPAAQFLMAGLYEAGHGVRANPLRACALYLRAASASDNPFGRQALWLFGAMSERGREFHEHCQALASVGFDHGFEPRTFDLGIGHHVTWTLTAATVTYDSRTRRHDMPLASSGGRFLPLHYTELATGPTRAEPRHFVDVFVWHPAAGRHRWALVWNLFEVVGDQVIRIDTPAPLVELEGDTPPAVASFDVRKFAVVRTDNEGYAEWAVLEGPNQARGRVPSDTERREVREEAAARKAALEHVDWDDAFDRERAPALNIAGADGCGQLQVYGWSADRAEAIVVSAARSSPWPDTPVTFELARDLDVRVAVYVHGEPQRQFYFCSGVSMTFAGDRGPAKWLAVAGSVVIEPSPPGLRPSQPDLRRVRVVLNGLVLRNERGTTVSVARPVVLNTWVMWK
jgi:hypothetical protein